MNRKNFYHNYIARIGKFKSYLINSLVSILLLLFIQSDVKAQWVASGYDCYSLLGGSTSPGFQLGATFSPIYASVCENTTNNDINSLLYTNVGGPTKLYWTVYSNATHGTVAGNDSLDYVVGGSTVYPTNFTYTPNSGYVGFDTFCIILMDTAVGGYADTAITTYIMQVLPPSPDSGVISGSNTVCIGSIITLGETVTGGTWGASNNNATFADSIITGTVAGIDTIKYVVNNGCGIDSALYIITVDPLPDSGTVTGTLDSVCVGSTITYADAATGGTWIAALGLVSVTTSGVISGITVGVDTVKYTVNNSCGTAIATKPVYVNPLPDAGTITGTAFVVCATQTITLNNATTGGTWSASNGNASVAGGIVTGNSAGTDIISYTVTNSCGTLSATVNVTVNPEPNAGSITGAFDSVCLGSTITYADAATGGSWSAVVGLVSISTGGVILGNTVGVDTIKYSVSNSCGTSIAVKPVYVNPNPNAGTITGTTFVVCPTLSITLNNATTGGTWSASNGNASVAGGIVTGNLAGTDMISYTVSNSCGTVSATANVTVNPDPNAGTITPTTIDSVCVSSNITYTDAATGGTWSRVVGLVSITTGGIISGITVGVDTIKYTVTNSCGTAIAANPVYVNPLPNSGTITGTAFAVCPTLTITLNNATTGGTWSASNGNASVAGGIVTGNLAGTDIISYTVSNSCGTASATVNVTVNPDPNAGLITGAFDSVCVSATITYADAATGGTWSRVVGLVNVTTGGVISGITVGVDTIKYTVINGCGTAIAEKPVYVNPLPNAGTITGTTFVVCPTQTITLNNATTGGTWSESNGNASVAGGVVTGNSAGTDVISYSFTNSCGTATATVSVTVNPASNAGTVTGADSVCQGSTITMTETVTGGTWSTLFGHATITTGGVVSGITTGVDTISYTFTNSCGTTIARHAVIVDSLPLAITGSVPLCSGATITLTDGTSGGFWSSVTGTVATITTGGVIHGTFSGSGSGTSLILYTTYPGGCTRSTIVTVNQTPAVVVGPASMCEGASFTFTEITTGGTWNSTNTTIATVTGGGIVTAGASVGVTKISYNIGTCGDTVTLNVTAQPTAILGGSSVCLGTTITLTDAVTGGVWSSNNTAIDTISATGGVLGGIAVGTAIDTYSIGNCFVTASITVNQQPVAIVGSSALCNGYTITLTDATTGGSWSSSAPSIATITTAGVVTGASSGTGTTVITYQIGSCFVVQVVTLNPMPAPITAPSAICVGSTYSVSDITTGGAWGLLHNTTGATLGGSETITGVAAGTTTLTYMVGTCYDSVNITIDSLPSIIVGPSSVCSGSTISLTDTLTGGTWTSASGSIASVTTGGVVLGGSSGSTSITYSRTGCFVTKPITVDVNPVPISGLGAVCSGASITLSELTTGGIWSVDNGSIASVTTGGVVTGWVVGTANITYTIGVCTATHTVIVDTLPVPITGPDSMCKGSSITFADATTGGTWSSVVPSIASVTTGGVVTGNLVGSTIISYSFGGCAVSKVISVDVQPLPITGPTTICFGTSVTFTDATGGGGTWSSSNSSNISIGSSSGVAAGLVLDTATIYYTIGICSAKLLDTVKVQPTAITGLDSVCQTATISLSDAATGGTWTSGGANATVDVSGHVTGVSVGFAPISYSIGSCYSTKLIYVRFQPSPITGPDSVCNGSSVTLSDATTGGAWSSVGSAASIALSGIVTSISVGTDTISYTVGTCAATRIFSVNPVPTAILSTSSHVCLLDTLRLSDALTGGTWSSSNNLIDSIGSVSGILTGKGGGSATITYTMPTGCYTTKVISVSPTAILGLSSVCRGATDTLKDTTLGGNWSSGSTTIATVTTGGVVTGLQGGSTFISYTVGACTARMSFTVDTPPPPPAVIIYSRDSICVNDTTKLKDVTTGGVWSTNNPLVDSVGVVSGIVKGRSAGMSIISYTIHNSCGTTSQTKSIKVLPLPNAGLITGNSALCTGTQMTLYDTVAGGKWLSTNTARATIDSATGIVTSISAGIDTIKYKYTNFCGTAYASKPITVDMSVSVFAISGNNSVCAGLFDTLSDATTGGKWSSNNPGVALIDSMTGIVFGVISGNTTITYTVTNSCGVFTATYDITVNPIPVVGTIHGIRTNLCQGDTLHLSDSITVLGSWISSMPSRASTTYVGPGQGLIKALDSGNVVISYSVSSPFGCPPAVATYNIAVTDTPKVSPIAGSSVVCTGAYILLSDVSYPVNGIFSASNNHSVVSGDTVRGVTVGVDTITYRVTNSCGTKSITKVITINLTPAAGVITGPSAVCLGSNISLVDTFSGGLWFSTNSHASVSGGVVHGNSVGVDTIRYTVTNSCGAASAIHSVTVNPLPYAGVITGPTSFCSTGSVTLTNVVSGGVWSSSNPFIATITTGGVITVGVLPGIDTFRYTYTNSCGSADTFHVDTIYHSPNSGVITSVSGLDSFCAGTKMVMHTNGDTLGGAWSCSNANATMSGDTVFGITMGLDTVIYTVTNNCGTVNSKFGIKILPQPYAAQITGGANVCSGATITLYDSTAHGSYFVTNNYAVLLGMISDSAASFRGDSSNMADQVLYVVHNFCGYDTAKLVLTVQPHPNVPSIIRNYSFTKHCKGTVDTLKDYWVGSVWSSSDTNVASLDSIYSASDSRRIVNCKAPDSTIITLTGYNSYNCGTSRSFVLHVLDTPDYTISGVSSNILCNGINAGSITEVISGGFGPFKYKWSNNDSVHLNIDSLSAGAYIFNVKELSTLCVRRDSFVITQPTYFKVDTFVDDDHCNTSNGRIILTPTGGVAPYKYAWSNGVTIDSVDHLPAHTTLTVTITDSNNCVRDFTINIKEGICNDINVHNVITPNGDGVNDTWVIDEIDYYPTNSVQIFDKWGDLVYEKSNYANQWDGRGKNGELLPDGTYFYVVKLNAVNYSGASNIKTGSILIKR